MYTLWELIKRQMLCDKLGEELYNIMASSIAFLRLPLDHETEFCTFCIVFYVNARCRNAQQQVTPSLFDEDYEIDAVRY